MTLWFSLVVFGMSVVLAGGVMAVRQQFHRNRLRGILTTCAYLGFALIQIVTAIRAFNQQGPIYGQPMPDTLVTPVLAGMVLAIPAGMAIMFLEVRGWLKARTPEHRTAGSKL